MKITLDTHIYKACNWRLIGDFTSEVQDAIHLTVYRMSAGESVVTTYDLATSC